MGEVSVNQKRVEIVRIREHARRIAFRSSLPDFYKDFAWATHKSGQIFETDALIAQLRGYVAGHLENDFGHGLKHSVKVTLDAGALMLIEQNNSESLPLKQGLEKKEAESRHRGVIIVQCAGLLHDLKRKEKDHAIKGAEYARKILRDYPLSKNEVEVICLAIRNHEAFKEVLETDSSEGLLVSDCLYDADKFRWGPDNFTDTVWEMISFSQIPLSKFMALYPKGMESLARIKDTFRTRTGKKYGPQFIDIGLVIGEELYEVIKTEFAQFL